MLSMKAHSTLNTRRRKAREQLAAIGNVLEGSLCRADRGESIRYQLTDKVAGKSRTLYVPVDMAGEVREWTQNWKKAKLILKKISELSREELRAGAQGAGQPRTPKVR